ncbi:MAG: hypothetical protein QXR93_06790 [Archaeoglobaceae archaeon]
MCEVRGVIKALRKIVRFVIDERATLNTMIALALGFAVLVTVIMVTNFIGASIFSAIQPQLSGITDSNVSSAITSTTYGTFKGLEIFGSMIQVVVVVIIASIILALIVRAFGGVGRGGGGAV